jgi:AcrR family transcriptional regulator
MKREARSAAPVRERRSHAERTAETRERIMTAVVESISEVGFQKTTAAEIARRAGITWGAVQHHFGGKDGILRAVLEDSFARFAARIADVPAEGASLETRVGLFIDRAWAHFCSDHYRSTFEILLSYASADEAGAESLWQSEMFDAWDRIWQRIFADTNTTRRRSAILQHYTISVLSGLASTRMLGSPSDPMLAAELALLKSTLVRELQTPAA